VARYDSELPSAYPALACLALSFFTALLVVAAARRHDWVFMVIVGLVSLYFAYATVTWVRKMFRRR
jgi:1,4-dihydroxy-2-naphthoate octaprenyltransferase